MTVTDDFLAGKPITVTEQTQDGATTTKTIQLLEEVLPTTIKVMTYKDLVDFCESQLTTSIMSCLLYKAEDTSLQT